MDRYRIEASREWENARRKAMWAKILHSLAPTSSELLNFDDVSKRLRLKNTFYRGRYNIPINKIVGSVGRYQDFTRAFLPTGNIAVDRWTGVAAAYLNPTSAGVPPIEVFKVGDSYFVKDGNHRVSVARQLGLNDIEAYVWEYSLPNLDPNADIDHLLIQAERQDFLRETNLDKLRPHHNIEITVPGGYTELLYQIENYQIALSKIDDTEVPYEEAVTAWYDMIYETIIQKIRAEGLLELFPNRTEADFFVWATRHHQELKANFDRPVMLSQSLRIFRKKNRPTTLNRLRRFLRRLKGKRPDEPLI